MPPKFGSSGSVASLLSFAILSNGNDTLFREGYAPVDWAAIGIPDYLGPLVEKAAFQRPVSRFVSNVTNASLFVNDLQRQAWSPAEHLAYQLPWSPTLNGTLRRAGGAGRFLWLLADNVVHIRATVMPSVFFIAGIHVPPLQLRGRNIMSVSVWARDDPTNLYPSFDSADTEAGRALAMLSALGQETTGLDVEPQARFFTVSFGTMSNIILGGVEGGGGCSTFNGQKVTERIVQRHLRYEVTGLMSLMYGDGICSTFSIETRNCAFTQSIPLSRSGSPKSLSLSVSNDTVTPAPTRTRTDTATRKPLLPYGESESERRVTATLNSFSTVGSLLAMDATVALDAGLALGLISLISRCHQYHTALFYVGDAGQRAEMKDEYTRRFLSRSISFPESAFGMCVGGDSLCELRGAVVGGMLLLLLAALATTALGFVAARSAMRAKALARWKEREARDRRRSARSRSRGRGGRRRPGSREEGDEEDDLDGEEEDESRLTEAELARRQAQEQRVMARVNVTVIDVVRHARYPYIITFVSALQLATWISNAAALLLAPFLVSAADRFFFGALVLVGFWLVPGALCCVLIQTRGLTRNFKESDRRRDFQLDDDNNNSSSSSRRDNKGGCCFAPMTSLDAFQLEQLALWSRLDYNDDGERVAVEAGAGADAGWRAKVLSLLRNKNSAAKWFLVPQYVWTQGTRFGIAQGPPGCFLRQFGSVVLKHHGPHGWSLVRALEREERKKQREARGNNIDSSSSSNTEQQSTSNILLVLETLRCRVSPFTVYITSIFVVAVGIVQAIAAMDPDLCVSSLTAVTVLQVLSLLFLCLVRPFLLRFVNVTVVASSTFIFVAAIVATAFIATGRSGGYSSEAALGAADTGVAAALALIQVGIVLIYGKVFAAGCSKALVLLGIASFATEHEASRVLDKEERARRKVLRRSAQRDAASLSEIEGALEDLLPPSQRSTPLVGNSSSSSAGGSGSGGGRPVGQQQRQHHAHEQQRQHSRRHYPSPTRLQHQDDDDHYPDILEMQVLSTPSLFSRRATPRSPVIQPTSRNADLDESFLRRPLSPPPQGRRHHHHGHLHRAQPDDHHGSTPRRERENDGNSRRRHESTSRRRNNIDVHDL